MSQHAGRVSQKGGRGGAGHKAACPASWEGGILMSSLSSRPKWWDEPSLRNVPTGIDRPFLASNGFIGLLPRSNAVQ